MGSVNLWLALIGNLAVVFSLVFVAIQMRQSTKVERAKAYRELTQDIAAWRTVFATHPALADAYRNRHSIDKLDLGLGWMMNTIMGSYENAYFAWRLGIISDREWGRFREGACIHWIDQNRESFDSPYLAEEFKNYMREICVKRQA